jgi:hypothetical protein
VRRAAWAAHLGETGSNGQMGAPGSADAAVERPLP